MQNDDARHVIDIHPSELFEMLESGGAGTTGEGEGMGIFFQPLDVQRKLVLDAELWPTAMQKFAGAHDTALSPPLSSIAS